MSKKSLKLITEKDGPSTPDFYETPENSESSVAVALAEYPQSEAFGKVDGTVMKTGKKGKQKSKSNQVGSSRGIETMFRTSYQAQLDMINLATTKSNIMISLNGVLISVLLISGAYLINSMPMLVVPISSLLLTCTGAVIFALLSARPESRKDNDAIKNAGSDNGALLIFEDFARLPSEQYSESMMEMLLDSQRVYKNMVAHIHDMGSTANAKFGMLYLSYSTFMVGLVVSVVLLLAGIAKELWVVA